MPEVSPNTGATRSRVARLLALLVVALVPLLLCVALGRYEAERISRREAALASAVIVGQVVSIVEAAQGAARTFVSRVGEPCEQLSAGLTLEAANVPYVRTLNILDEDRVDCSSALVQQPIPARGLLDGHARVPGDEWLRFVNNTPMVHNRPSLLVGITGGAGRAAVAVVDAQYLLDLLHGAAPLTMFREAELSVGGGVVLREAQAAVRDAPLLADVRKRVSGATIELKMYGRPERIRETGAGLLLRYMPWAAALSALLVWLVRRLQRSGQSRRDQLLRAIRADEFHVEYQPLYGVASGRCDGVEALLRWVPPGAGAMRPDEFIQAAEEEHVIVPLTQHLLKLIARDVATWDVEPGFHLGINFAPEHLSGVQLVGDVRALCAVVVPRGIQVVLEVTERTLVRNTGQARSNLEALRREGVEIAIDDFGTGYCALSYLEKFPFDILKIDRGFVLTIDPEDHRAVVLDCIIDLAHSLGAELVAEGVETQAHLDYLCVRGVTYIQGFVYAKPMPSEAFMRWYRANGARAIQHAKDGGRALNA
ncbi:EAL domain-containing protein [Paraburkholderia lycopersici]|uniref:cyclic-guanylate-specific phosphodiesterase n=1 Tax=Paraburkholderia lycopersici TaxID=416944 RepID=A0A1G6TNM3_9BURK|nr:EAL domain-containing protein [Paraburkholderia lycopersici]SDD30086.1 EAL domain, c-di-GMP-specific phosphodiesterase class I (or its enzymatically inactive variant) [Paraburkholderia lycopersici]